jgi:hypothetical protein
VDVTTNVPQARALNVTRIPIPIIALTLPADDTSLDLKTIDKVLFEWTNIKDIYRYTLKISLSPDMSSGLSIDMFDSPVSLTGANLNTRLEALGLVEYVPTKVYWSVCPTDSTVEFTKQVRSATVIRFTNIVLSMPAHNATARLSDGDIIFTWKNVPKITAYRLQLSRTNDMASPQIIEATGNPLFLTPAVVNEKLAALGIQSITTDIYWSIVPALNVPANTEVRKLSVERAIKYDRSTWTVTSSSGTATGGFEDPAVMLDGNRDTHWSPNYNSIPGVDKYAWAIFDMKSIKTVTKIYARERQRVQTLTWSLSEDEQNWTQVGVMTFTNGTTAQEQTMTLVAPTPARYIRMDVYTSWANISPISEVEAYGLP